MKPCIKRPKNDAADAEMICETVARPNLCFVPKKTAKRQNVLVLRRCCDLLICQCRMMLNAIRVHLSEFGNIAAQRPSKVVDLVGDLWRGETLEVRKCGSVALMVRAAPLDGRATAIRDIERQLLVWHRQNAASQCLATIPDVGVITATALAANIPVPSTLKSGRQSRLSSALCCDKTRPAARTASATS
nr:hypothetical protein [Tabrizicola sp.]